MTRSNHDKDQPKYISASQLKTWITCQWQYHLRYGLGIPGEESEAIYRGKVLHESLFSLITDLLDWRSLDHPFLKILQTKFKHKPKVEPKIYQKEDTYLRLAIPDLVSAADKLVVDLKTVTQLQLIHNIYESDYLQMAFYRIVTKYPRSYILKLYQKEDGEFFHRWHYIPFIREHQELLLRVEREELKEYWAGNLKPMPNYKSCRFCTHQKFCFWYQEVKSGTDNLGTLIKRTNSS